MIKKTRAKKLTIYIDREDKLQIDHDKFIEWFSSMVKDMGTDDLEEHEIPYHVFCCGAEAALRCQQMKKIH
tara:strand:+ start:190 stop:402 length:213 start_codon:yes stop_codon:yes gene_type:complete